MLQRSTHGFMNTQKRGLTWGQGQGKLPCGSGA